METTFDNLANPPDGYTINRGALAFFNLVKHMREQQKLYFETRDRRYLVKAKWYEEAVDGQIKRGAKYLEGRQQQIQESLIQNQQPKFDFK